MRPHLRKCPANWNAPVRAWAANLEPVTCVDEPQDVPEMGVARSIRGFVAIGKTDSPRNGAGEQKIPVIIDFPPIGKPVWPGMRVAVNIVIR